MKYIIDKIQQKICNLRKAQDTTDGFTIIETLVSISILMLIIAATFTGAQSGLQTSIISRDQVISFYLAQEVFEYVKNNRDTEILSGDNYDGWVTTITSNCDEGGQLCYLDVYDLSESNRISICNDEQGIDPLDPQSCPYLRKSSVGQYGHDSNWEETNIKRYFTVTQGVDQDEIKVDVYIIWESSRTTRTFAVSEYIYNWRP